MNQFTLLITLKGGATEVEKTNKIRRILVNRPLVVKF